ncbi:PLD nuclease N-terminal domain-containing protein [Agromyces sp. Leaf222]|uniref:PLD nuclease N-terminal domain-containing protein n=1 Tax=Agromyces sp. Leaf222 TaxID=1735688 RepID=UPI0009E6F2B7|nr:PLD nuclease N-terminal domain-containing protein [Agromyces sp. Leaf222]
MATISINGPGALDSGLSCDDLHFQKRPPHRSPQEDPPAGGQIPETRAARVCQTEAVFGNLTGWHLIILSVIWIIPLVVTVVSIARDQVASGTARAVWVLIALLFPWLGLILWFTIGRKPAPTA